MECRMSAQTAKKKKADVYPTGVLTGGNREGTRDH
jgi:hypothetical protein